MAASNPARNEIGLSLKERRWRRERRSAWLRLLVLGVLVLNLLASGHGDSVLVHGQVIAGYSVATIVALILALTRRGPAWSTTAFVVVDALLVVALFHEHLFAPGQDFDHSLTAPTLAVGFLLLTHAALRLKPGLVVLFSAVVLIGWLLLLAITLVVHAKLHPMAHSEWSTFGVEGALAAAFTFAGFVCYLLTKEHNVALAEALGSEGRRRMLARFFSPSLVAELQSNDAALALTRRRAAIMFVDLRSFTRLTEASEPEAMAALQRYAWPGNIRELENVVERGLVLGTGEVLRFDRQLIGEAPSQPAAGHRLGRREREGRQVAARSGGCPLLRGPDRLRAVLSDPHVGSFGVVAIALQLIAKLALLHALIARAPLAADPRAGRDTLRLGHAGGIAAEERCAPLLHRLVRPVKAALFQAALFDLPADVHV